MLMSRRSRDQELLNRFFDQEVGPGESIRIREHLKHCDSCQRALRDHHALSTHFRTGLAEGVSRADLAKIEENVLAVIQRKETPWRTRLRELFLGKRFYVPAAATAVVLVLFLALFRHPSPMPGPSAIVSSVEGDVASVMILETPESHQTIVWITENLTSNGEHNGNG
jgi:anti-sigma factor RsiW